MYKILDNLATHGIGEPGILKGYSECKQGLIDRFRIIDVTVMMETPSGLLADSHLGLWIYTELC